MKFIRYLQDEKGFAVIPVIVILIVAGAAGYWIWQKKPIDKWTKANFPDNYHHSVDVTFPSSWRFDCCADADSFSAHLLYPDSSTNPLITIIDFALFGCPDGKYNSCSINELKKTTPSQYMTSLISHLEAGGEVVGISSSGKTGSVKLKNFPSVVPVYRATPRLYWATPRPLDLYLIQSSKGVVGIAIDVNQSKNFGNLTTGLLNRLAPAD